MLNYIQHYAYSDAAIELAWKALDANTPDAPAIREGAEAFVEFALRQREAIEKQPYSRVQPGNKKLIGEIPGLGKFLFVKQSA